MNKRILLIGNNCTELYEALNLYFSGNNTEIIYYTDNNTDEYIKSNNFDLIILNDFDAEISYNILCQNKVIKIHPSLLPAFKCKNAIEETFKYGSKVGGITIYSLNPYNDIDKIIMQYPVLINYDKHIDEYTKDLSNLEKILVPPIAKSILNDTVIDIAELFNKNNNKGCACCSSCRK